MESSQHYYLLYLPGLHNAHLDASVVAYISVAKVGQHMWAHDGRCIQHCNSSMPTTRELGQDPRAFSGSESVASQTPSSIAGSLGGGEGKCIARYVSPSSGLFHATQTGSADYIHHATSG